MRACAACGSPLSLGARFCPGCGAPAAEPPPAAEERKLATVLFADLVGSTALAEGQDPERTRALLDRFYDAMAEEIERAGGTVEKFAGDAVMAAFGAPAALEDHAERALHAALALQQRMRELFGDRLQLRIGVNTGEVVVGRAREGSSFVTGDAVNVCARLEQAAAAREVFAGERTVQAVRGAFEFGEERAVEARGKSSPVRARPLVRALTLMRPRGVSGLGRAFVGRERELELLQAAYRRAVDTGTPRVVTIVGNAGVGKTRLVRELWGWLAGQEPQPLQRTGRCLSYGRGITYWPLAEVLREQLGLLESDPPELALERLGARELLGLTLGLDVGHGLHPMVARERLHDAWVDFVSAVAAERPLALLVEDLHWADGELVALLGTLVDRVAAPMLLVCTARPEVLDLHLHWMRARAAAATLELEPLDPGAAEQMLAELLGSALPDELRETLVVRSEGNPLFLEELVQTLIDRAVLLRTDGVWTAGELPAAFEVPDTVQAVVAARIDLLAHDEKAALQAASVIGRVFWTGPVYELVAGATPDFSLLEERDFVRRRSGSAIAGEREYAIKHALTRDVAYASLPKARRARLHAAFAGWLEGFGEGRDEHAALLAHHYAEAVRPEDADLVWTDAEDEHRSLRAKAVHWLRRAGELATHRFEVAEAIALLRRALTLADDDATRAAVLRELAVAHVANYDVEEFRRGLEDVLALDPTPELAAEAYSLLGFYGRGRHYMWKQPPPPELGDAWIEQAFALSRPGTAARARALLARTLVAPDEGEEGAVEAFTLAEAMGDVSLLNQSIEARSLVASVAGRFDEAAAWIDQALEAISSAAEAGGVRTGMESFHAFFVYLRAGRVAAAARHAEVLERWAPTAHDRVHATAAQALLLAATGRWAELAELAARAEAAAAANGETPCQFNWRALLVCALGLAHGGDERESRRLEQLGVASAVVAGPAEREAALLRLAVQRGERSEAERILELLPQQGGAWDADGRAARLDALVALGDRRRVEEEAQPLLERPSLYRPFALRALGSVRADAALLEEAQREFAALGLAWQAEQTRAPVAGRRLS